MRTRLKLKPGQKGTKMLLEEYGEQLVCVRYRYDAEKRKRYKTVELTVEEIAWEPRAKRLADEAVVGVRVGREELELRRQVKGAGARWNPERVVWELRYDRVRALGLERRIVTEPASNSR